MLIFNDGEVAQKLTHTFIYSSIFPTLQPEMLLIPTTVLGLPQSIEID